MKTTSELVHAVLGAVGETQPAGGDVALDDFLQTRLVDGDVAGLKGLDLLLVVVHADDVMADIGETRPADQPHVAAADN